MSAPRSDRSEELSLQGTQVNIANRSHYKEKKNSQNSIMYSRPFSAIPSTYKKEKPNVSLAKRPLSADTIFCNDKKYESEEFCLMNANGFYETLPMKESNNEVHSFPSAQLLKTLLSERLDRSWNNIENGLQKSISFDANSVDSITDSDKSLGTKIQELAQRPTTEQGILVPGIKTKPPLPDKQKRKCESISNNNNAVQINIFKPKENQSEFEQHEDETCKQNYNYQPLQTDKMNTISFRLADNCFVEDLEESDKSDQFYSIINDKKSKTSDTIKNWIQENNDNIPELYDIEQEQIDSDLKKTENSFSNIETLFKYNGKESGRINNNNETTRNDSKVSGRNTSRDVITYIKNKPNNVPDKSTIIKNRTNKTNNPKNIQITRNDSKTNKETNTLTKKPRGILKPTVKLKKDVPVEKNVKHNPVEKKTLQKTEEPCDFENIDDNVKSWMSTNTGHENFLDFLNKLDDLENLDENVRPENTALETDNNPNASTYDDIASILEVLEKEDLKSQKSIESLKEIINSEVSDSNNMKYFEIRSISTSSLESSSNYNEFLTYLDEVDQNCVKTLKSAKDRVKNISKVTNSAMNVDTIPNLEDLLNYTNVELAHYVVDLSLRHKEKSAGITVLQAELSKLRGLINSKSEEFDKCLKQKLHVQKNEYESVIKRHQKFIDQLIADKKTLNKQCEGVISEMKVLEDRYNTNTRAAEQKHKVELQKAKEMHMAAEKLRREKWIEGKTQKIKEMTVKSLEPELQNMTTRHQQELSDLRSLHKRELEDLELRAARKTQQQCEALRQQLTVEREAAIAHERDILRQRLEKLVESEEKGYQEQRRRLNAEHAARMAECEERIVTITNEKDRAIEGIKQEFDHKFETVQRRHKTELKNIKESLDLEFEVWKNNHKKQQTIKLAEMEAQMRDFCKKERDREIEMVIERLEQEATETKAQTEQAAENRLRRTKEKYEEEIKDLEKSVNEYKSKYSETKEKLLNQEDTIINLTTSMKQLQSQLQQAKDKSDELLMDRTKMREQIKEEFISEINALENEVKILKGSKEEELQKIFAKVKLTVAHKDELLTELTQNNTNLQEKCTMLENLLEQQRKEYLIKQ